jgi:hypothetical protein
VLIALLKAGLWGAAIWALPWVSLEVAIRAEGMGVMDRMSCLEIAFQN